HSEPGLNVLTARGPEPPGEQRERIRSLLLEARSGRVRPVLDEKRLTAWNALMIAALAETGAALSGREREAGVPAGTAAELTAAAVTCAEFILRELRAGAAAGGA